MINRIRELMQLKEAVDALTKQSKELEEANNKSCAAFEEVKEQLSELKTHNSKLLAQAKSDVDEMKSLRQSLQQELYDFRLFKKELKKDMLGKAEKEFSEAKDLMEGEVSAFNEAKRKIDLKLNSIDKLDSEIRRLAEVTKNIKAQDFELVRHKKDMDILNKEKLELLRKIDSLERLVARYRRR